MLLLSLFDREDGNWAMPCCPEKFSRFLGWTSALCSIDCMANIKILNGNGELIVWFVTTNPFKQILLEWIQVQSRSLYD